MDDDRDRLGRSRRQQLYRKKHRDENDQHEEGSDQSAADSEDSSIESDSPNKRTCHRSSSTSSGSDDQGEGEQSQHSSEQGESDALPQSDSSINQSAESNGSNNQYGNASENEGAHENQNVNPGYIIDNIANDPLANVPEDVQDQQNFLVDSPVSEAASSEDEESDRTEADTDAWSDSEDEAESEEEQGEEQEEGDRPLYDGAPITFTEGLLAIMTFILTHKLTGLCVNDLLSLIALLCGPNYIGLTTLHRFKKYFNMVGKKLVTCHYYCSECEIGIESADSVCVECNGRYAVEYFIEFPIVAQLEIMFSRTGFYESLMFRFNRVKRNEQNIEDVYDGIIYQQQVENGFLSNRNNLSFFMYFDGISLFKSSLFSIWPVYFTINELKYKLRTKKQNTVLAGIWFGKKKPNPNLFLVPFQEKLSSLENDGVNLALPSGEFVHVKVKLLG